MSPITTHVLDVARGKPAASVPVVLARIDANGHAHDLGRGATDDDGRLKTLLPEGALAAGTYRLTFDTAAYFASVGVEGFYPEAAITFVVRDASAHYHVPLLLSPFGYSTYRGS